MKEQESDWLLVILEEWKQSKAFKIMDYKQINKISM